MHEFLVIILGIWAGITIKASVSEAIMLVLAAGALFFGMVLAKKYEMKIVRSVLLLFAVSMVLAYSYGAITQILYTLIAGSVLFLTMYLFGKSNFYQWRIVGLMAVCLIPIMLLCTRIFGKPVPKTETYISFGPFLTLAWILLLLPLAMGFFLRNEIKLPWFKTLISVNHLMMVLWMAVNAYIAGVINSEYGTAMIICGVTGLMFLLYGRYWVAKGASCLMAVVAAFKVIEKNQKATIRFEIFQNINEAFQNHPGDAEPVMRIVDTAPLYGLWGLGHGTFQNKAAKSDYVISCLLMNYGLVFTIIVVSILMIFIVRICLIKTKDDKDHVMVETYGVILLVMTFLGIAGPLNSFLLTGVGTPFLSISGSMNSCLLGGLGMVIALKEKGEQWYETKLFW